MPGMGRSAAHASTDLNSTKKQPAKSSKSGSDVLASALIQVGPFEVLEQD